MHYFLFKKKEPPGRVELEVEGGNKKCLQLIN